MFDRVLNTPLLTAYAYDFVVVQDIVSFVVVVVVELSFSKILRRVFSLFSFVSVVWKGICCVYEKKSQNLMSTHATIVFQNSLFLRHLLRISGWYSESSQKSKMELFTKIIKAEIRELFRTKLHLSCLTESWVHLWISSDTLIQVCSAMLADLFEIES